jgi:DNA-binding beta-propeller fold protein YncE
MSRNEIIRAWKDPEYRNRLDLESAGCARDMGFLILGPLCANYGVPTFLGRKRMKMTRMFVGKLLIIYFALVAGCVLSAQAPPEVISGKYLNPLQVGLLSWYGGSQPNNISVGVDPAAVAFDGANIWVANAASNSVTKLRASDGTLLGTFAVGSAPVAVAFDGANVWVVNTGSKNVSKLRASDGAGLGAFAVGDNPFGLAFDGANIWVTNQGSNTVSKLRASDGTLLGTFPGGNGPGGAAFDGANIWIANFGSNTVSKL